MKKETLIAVILGILTGVVIAIFLIINSQNRVQSDKKIITPQISPTIKLIQPEIAVVKITSPLNNTISEKNTTVIKGNAPKDSLIIIHSPTSEKVQKNVEDNFSINFPLALGENRIKVTIYYKKDVEQKELKIYYFDNE